MTSRLPSTPSSKPQLILFLGHDPSDLDSQVLVRRVPAQDLLAPTGLASRIRPEQRRPFGQEAVRFVSGHWTYLVRGHQALPTGLGSDVLRNLGKRLYETQEMPRLALLDKCTPRQDKGCFQKQQRRLTSSPTPVR